MKSIGIDIGSFSIKVAEIQTTGKGFQVLALHSFPLSKTNSSDQELEIIELLRPFLLKYPKELVRMSVGLRQDKVSVRKKIFPFTDRRKILKSLAFELEDDLPFTSDSAIFDGQIICTRGPLSEVLTHTAPKHHIAHLVRLCDDLQIDPHVISAEGSALANIFSRWMDPPLALPVLADGEEPRASNLQLVLNIGHSHTTLCAFDHGMLLGIRTILWGGKNIAESIAKKYSLPPSEALKELKTKAFILAHRQDANYDAKIFSDLISSEVKELARDLQLAILELKGETKAEVTNIQLTGGVSGIQGLAPFLTQTLNVPVNTLQILDLLPCSPQVEKSADAQLCMGTAVGLAIENLRKFANPALNFRKEDFAPQTHKFEEFWNTWGPMVKMGAGAICAFVFWTYFRIDFTTQMLDDANKALRDQAKTVAHLPAKQANEANVKKFIKENRKKVAEMKTLQSLAGMNSAAEILKKISDATPAKNAITIEVKHLAIEDQHVSIEGYLAKQSELSLLQQALTNLSIDGKVTSIPSQLPALPGKMSFSFGFNADRNVKAAGSLE